MNKSVRKNEYIVKHARHDFRVTAPKQMTKTKRDYFWLVPLDFNGYIDIIKEHTSTGYSDWKKLNSTLAHYWDRKVLGQAKVPLNPSTNRPYSLKTARALKATQWVMLLEEYKVMKWEPHPPNPCLHIKMTTTTERYAQKGIDNVFEARLRCVKKYGSNPSLRQPWMDELLHKDKKAV